MAIAAREVASITLALEMHGVPSTDVWDIEISTMREGLVPFRRWHDPKAPEHGDDWHLDSTGEVRTTFLNPDEVLSFLSDSTRQQPVLYSLASNAGMPNYLKRLDGNRDDISRPDSLNVDRAGGGIACHGPRLLLKILLRHHPTVVRVYRLDHERLALLNAERGIIRHLVGMVVIEEMPATQSLHRSFLFTTTCIGGQGHPPNVSAKDEFLEWLLRRMATEI